MVSLHSKKPRCTPPCLSEVPPNVAFETGQVFVCLTLALSRPFKEDRLMLPLPTHIPSRQSMVLMSVVLCPQVVSQAPQHFRPSEKQGTCEGCFARQSINSVISLHSGMTGQNTKLVLSHYTRVLHRTASVYCYVYSSSN